MYSGITAYYRVHYKYLLCTFTVPQYLYILRTEYEVPRPRFTNRSSQVITILARSVDAALILSHVVSEIATDIYPIV